jgi:hypothetical protein
VAVWASRLFAAVLLAVAVVRLTGVEGSTRTVVFGAIVVVLLATSFGRDRYSERSR